MMGRERWKVAHLTTIDASLRYLVLPQLLAVVEEGGEPVGISAPGPFVQELREAGVRHIPLPASTRGMDVIADLRAAYQLWGILRRERPDVLHTHNPKPGLYGRVIGRLAGVPVVVNTVHGLYATPDDVLLKKIVVYSLEAVAARFSHVELVQSAEDFELLTRRRITRPSRTRLLGNGVDLERFDPRRFSEADRTEVREELGIEDGVVVIGMVGRLVAEKGYPELLEVAEMLDERFAVVCVGPDDPEKNDALPRELIGRARRRGVRFLGLREDVDRLYLAMDLFVLPSHREGFPRAAMEAAAMGLPVIATDIRGCREVVEDGVNGVLVGVADPEGLTRSIVELGSDPQLRDVMGQRSREKALREFDERRVVQAVLESYGVRDNLDPNGVTARQRKPRVDIPLWGRILKRALDLAVAVPMLIVAAPFMAVIAALIRFRLGGPVVFRQSRPGLHGQPFELVKFRTMTDETGTDGQVLPDDQRMTRLGVLLRKASLDELPELINVIGGKMSLVGPRPLLIRYLDRYSCRQLLRHQMKPGLTGWSQINGRNAMGWEEKLELDVWYVENWSMRLDIKILIQTLWAVVRRAGVNEPGHATASEFMGTVNQPEGEL